MGTSANAAAVLTASTQSWPAAPPPFTAAAVALVPYSLWCDFATVKSTDTWRHNR